MLALRSNISSALKSYSVDDRLESKLGDVLLLVQGYKRTTITSSFTKNCYYTLLDNNDSTSTSICRGNVMEGASVWLSPEHIATISVAKKANTSDWFGSMFRSSSPSKVEDKLGVDDAKEEVDEDFSEKEKDDCGICEDDEGHAEINEDKEVESMKSQDVVHEKPSKPKEVLMIKFGGAASKSTRSSIMIDPITSRVTIHSSEGGKYEWELVGNQPALFHCHNSSSKKYQVAWTRESHTSSLSGSISTFPGSLTVYPEVRPMLDAIIISLVGWQHLKSIHEVV